MGSRKEGHENAAHLPFWEPGSGHYGDTVGQDTRDIVNSSIPFIMSFIDSVPVHKDEVFTLADYGTNDGYATMPLFANIISSMRKKHGQDLPVQIIYEDQERNDFNSLFNRLTNSPSPVSQFSRVFPLVTNFNFYRQCVPDGTCNFVFTSMAAHWLGDLDMSFKNNVFHFTATEEEQCRFGQKAQEAWTTFLTLRAQEMKSGGLLIAFNLSTTENDKDVNDAKGADDVRGADDVNDTSNVRADVRQSGSAVNTSNGWGREQREGKDLDVKHQQDICLDLEAVWTQLREEEMITQEEYERCTSKEAIRTAREITAPFKAVTSPVHQAGLSLVSHDQFVIPCNYKTQWKDKLTKYGVDDRQEFATNMLKAHRVWSHSIFHSSLSDTRSEEEKAAIVDELYRRFHTRLLNSDPASYRSEMVLSRLVARKI